MCLVVVVVVVAVAMDRAAAVAKNLQLPIRYCI